MPETWFRDPSQAIRVPWSEPDKPFVKVLIVAHTSFYLFGTLYIVYATKVGEGEIGGRVPMVIHHAVTLFLLTVSLLFADQPKMGLLIQFAHNIADVFLHLAKTFHFANLKTLCELSWVLFAVSFVLSRNFYFGILVKHVIVSGWKQSFMLNLYAYSWPLLVLYALHIFWSLKIAQYSVSYMRHGSAVLEELVENVNTKQTGSIKPHRD
ncbi:hypothetical protein RCL1_002182 [Eukaryota sp. TZLM3-RCL]